MNLIVFYRSNPSILVARFGVYGHARRFLEGSIAKGDSARSYVLWDADKWEQVSCPETLPFSFKVDDL